MSNNVIKHNDKLHSRDELAGGKKFKTQILGGYGLYRDSRGIAQLEEVLLETENEIVLGGTLFALEKMFGVRSELSVEYLNDIIEGAPSGGTSFEPRYLAENFVCLFGVGTGGSGDGMNTVVDVDFTENSIVGMVPFRFTSETLIGPDADKYWFRILDEARGKTGYYLKNFELPPVIKALWDDGIGDEDGTEVTDGYTTSSKTDPIETFVELILKIDKNDVVEWFSDNGIIEQARVNSLGLFTGVKDTDPAFNDYKLVKMVSKFNFTNEMLTLSKNLEFIYRIYTA